MEYIVSLVNKNNYEDAPICRKIEAGNAKTAKQLLIREIVASAERFYLEDPDYQIVIKENKQEVMNMEKKTVYVVTHCAAEENYTPSVFSRKEDAVAEVKRLYDDCMEHEHYIDNEEFWEDGFEVVWQDDTYDRVDIFEVEQQ